MFMEGVEIGKFDMFVEGVEIRKFDMFMEGVEIGRCRNTFVPTFAI